jgi:hypothetical protein
MNTPSNGITVSLPQCQPESILGISECYTCPTGFTASKTLNNIIYQILVFQYPYYDIREFNSVLISCIFWWRDEVFVVFVVFNPVNWSNVNGDSGSWLINALL